MLYETIIHKEPILKGWSGDLKYCAGDASGNRYLLRISPIEKQERIQREFGQMQKLAALGISMCLPIECGICEEGVYSLQSWVDGEDAEGVIADFSPKQQYAYGMDAGKILQKIHSLAAPTDAEPWSQRFNRKIDRKLAMYADCPLKYEFGDAFIAHIARSRHLLQDRPQTYQHGDYHIGNMMIDRSGTLVVIDFDRDDYGDPWEEFNRIVWCAQAAPAFASGMVDGYFPDGVPHEFWHLLALYISSNTLSSLPWAVPFGEQEIQTMRKQAREILQWYDNMSKTVPFWYHKP